MVTAIAESRNRTSQRSGLAFSKRLHGAFEHGKRSDVTPARHDGEIRLLQIEMRRVFNQGGQGTVHRRAQLRRLPGMPAVLIPGSQSAEKRHPAHEYEAYNRCGRQNPERRKPATGLSAERLPSRKNRRSDATRVPVRGTIERSSAPRWRSSRPLACFASGLGEPRLCATRCRAVVDARHTFRAARRSRIVLHTARTLARVIVLESAGHRASRPKRDGYPLHGMARAHAISIRPRSSATGTGSLAVWIPFAHI